jgi:hypothetical protein
VTTETKFVFVLAGFSVLLLLVGSLFAKRLASAPPRVIRTVWPLAAAFTGACFAVLVLIARTHVKG